MDKVLQTSIRDPLRAQKAPLTLYQGKNVVFVQIYCKHTMLWQKNGVLLSTHPFHQHFFLNRASSCATHCCDRPLLLGVTEKWLVKGSNPKSFTVVILLLQLLPLTLTMLFPSFQGHYWCLYNPASIIPYLSPPLPYHRLFPVPLLLSPPPYHCKSLHFSLSTARGRTDKNLTSTLVIRTFLSFELPDIF